MDYSLSICAQLIFICILHSGDGIYDGEEAEVGDFSYFAKLFISTTPEFIHCGGVVIDEFHILTAAHCVAKIRPNKISISLGTNQITNEIRFWGVDQIHVHPNFKPLKISCMDIARDLFVPCFSGPLKTKAATENDIAVVKTIQIIPLGGSITKVDLPESDSVPFCEELRYAGWGLIDEASIPNHLQWTRVLIIEQEECSRYYSTLREEHCCVIATNGISSIASGDSDSPLTYENIVYGITSFTGGESSNLPVVFAKVFSHRDFIENATRPQRFRG